MLWYNIRLFYFRYQVNFALYMLSPGEKLVCNTLVLLVFGVLVYYVVPLLLLPISRSILRQFTVQSVDRIEIQTVYKVVDSSMDAARCTDLGAQLRWPVSMQEV